MTFFPKKFCLIALSLGAAVWSCVGGAFGCGNTPAGGSVNPHFEDIQPSPTTPSGSIDPNNADQVTVIEPDIENKGARIGTIADVDPSHVLCVILDPASGDIADLEVCEADKINTETRSAEGLCPEADQPSRCSSRNGGSEPDFCEVTGANDYAFVLLNLSGSPVTVAYQVIDVSGYPNKSCSDLNITEDSIRSDE